MSNKLKASILRLGALTAFLLSLVGFFLPISFEWNDYSNYVINWFIAAINCENEPVFLMILTCVTLLVAIIAVLMRKPLSALIDGVLALILFIVLLLLIPDAEPMSTAET